MPFLEQFLVMAHERFFPGEAFIHEQFSDFLQWEFKLSVKQNLLKCIQFIFTIDPVAVGSDFKWWQKTNLIIISEGACAYTRHLCHFIDTVFHIFNSLGLS